MLRAMLVDDEQMALEGLKLLIDWGAEGFCICAECINAVEALERLREARPDLIVTDIRMPGMDGLQLMQATRAKGFAGQFVVATGYGDFEYAQQALRIGVAGYLLKPVDPSDASDVLAHVRRRLIAREADDTKHRAAYERGIALFLTGQGGVPVKLPERETWRLASWGAPLPYERVQEVLGSFPDGAVSAHIVEDKEFIALHWPNGSKEPSWDAAEALLRCQRRRLIKSEPVEGVNDLPAVRSTLAASLSEDFGAMQECLSALSRAVAHRQVDQFKQCCAELQALCAACGAETIIRARRQLIADCTRQLAGRPAELQRLLAEQDANLEALGLLAIRLLAPVQGRISDRVASHVAAHLAERWTLEGVAEALGYNATYLGRVFREEKGVGFREWIGNWRMEKAASLLLETDAPVYGVADQVGYSQYKWFLAHFKRRYGQTPEQYRRRNTRK